MPTKICLVKAMVFPVVMYGCESWTIKKAEHRRIDAFELWCWRRLLRDLSTARSSNLSILKEINPEYSLEELMLKLKLQYFGHLIRSTDLFKKRPWSLLGLLAKIKCEKDPDSGRDWRWEEKGMTEDEVVRWHHQFNGHEFEVTPGVGDGQGGLACCSPCDRKELHVIEQLNWIELMQLPYKCFLWFHYWPSINQFIHSSPVS